MQFGVVNTLGCICIFNLAAADKAVKAVNAQRPEMSISSA